LIVGVHLALWGAARLYWTVNSTAGTITIGLAAKVSHTCHPTPTRFVQQL